MHSTEPANTLSNQTPKDWEILEFPKTIHNQRIAVGKVKKQDYSPSGKYPIIDQSQDFIAGYSDDEALVYRGTLPVVIFGDHTRIFKYVDFPFISGADGTKVLLPDQKFVHPKYYYYALLNLDIPSKGYNRHFKLLKEQVMPIPPLPEQRAIAHVLSTVRQAIDATEGYIVAARELKRSMMKHLFTYGPVPVHEADQVTLKDTEIGKMPEAWDVKRIGELADIKTGGTPLRSNPNYWDGNIPWVKTGEINYNIITKTEEYITEEGFQNSSAKMIPVGTLLMAMYGQGVTRGKVAILGIEATLNQACAAFYLSDNISPKFLFYYFSHDYERIRNMGHGAHQKNLSATILKNLLVAIPPCQQQIDIFRFLNKIDNKINAEIQRKEALEMLFHSLLHHLMTGKARVKL